MKSEFELVIKKLELEARDIPYSISDEHLYIDHHLDFDELELILNEFDFLVESDSKSHVVTHNWCSI